MSDRTSIEWAEATWNPTTGCDRVSTGCDNCYALRLAGRLKKMGAQKYQQDGNSRTSGPGFGLVCHPDKLDVPEKWKKPRDVFVDSMSDLFHSEVPEEFIRRVFATIVATPRHTYQILTKRSARLSSIAGSLPWPENLWMGVSIENQQYAFRVDQLKETPAAVKFVSAEPLLGPLRFSLTGLDWVIAGGESGPGCRPMETDWVRTLRDDCVNAEVPFFFKQWGGRTPKSNGRELDGRVWNQKPQRTAGVTGTSLNVVELRS